RLTGRPYTLDLLVRTKKTKRQVGLTEEGRAGNLDGAFSVRGVVPDEVLLVDDVLTTGATARAAAAVLKLAGVRRVEVLTVARAYSSA
ncbi:MAG: ComF family protein, partial [Myxococcaceae bacterium]